MVDGTPSGTDAGRVGGSARRDLRLYWASGAANQFGTHCAAMTLVVLALALGAGPAAAGLLGSAAVAAETLMGFTGGVMADLWSRRRIMAISALIAFAASAVLVGALLTGTASLPLLFAVTTTEAAAGAVYVAAARGSLPALLPDGADYTRVVGTLRARDQAAAMLGPLVGGVLYQLTRWLPFAVNALSYVVAAGCVRALRTDLSRAPAGSAGPEREPLPRFAFEGVRHLWGQPFLRFALVWGAGVNAVFTAAYYLVLIASRERGSPASTLGLVLALASGLGVVGALLAPALLRRSRPGVLVAICSWLMVLLVAPLGSVRSDLVYVPLLGGVFLVGPVLSVLFQSATIAVIPPPLQGRATAALALGVDVVQLVAPAAAGLLLWRLSPTAAGLALAAALAVLAAYASTGVRRLDRALADRPGRPAAASSAEVI